MIIEMTNPLWGFIELVSRAGNWCHEEIGVSSVLQEIEEIGVSSVLQEIGTGNWCQFCFRMKFKYIDPNILPASRGVAAYSRGLENKK